ncbi:hypothetical protein F2Q70_00031608 [Brassica cretica]|uniref:Uncharacterized protein n=1 Tax=Brassica cretica TaxID=69181 RepID=A0A8S9MH23_BRACR|nr:hypothetical protein F2Q70_00031608 [Brassica cretica]KAF2619215.1 hypothetical protein F2Q68_00040970 [Brassica cretica]
MNLSVTLCVDLLDDEEADEISISGPDEIKTKDEKPVLTVILVCNRGSALNSYGLDSALK